MRVLLAFLLAPSAGAFLFAAWLAISDHVNAVPYDRIGIFTFIAPLFIGGYPPAVFIGVPIFFVFRNTKKSKLLVSIIAGALVASAPWLILATVLFPDAGGFLKWLESLQETAIPAFFCGSGAGVVFWLVAK